MKRKKKQALLLSGLLVVWGWVLFNQFVKDAPTEEQAEAAPRKKVMLIDAIRGTTSEENERKPILLTPDRKTRQAQKEALKNGPDRDLFFFAGTTSNNMQKKPDTVRADAPPAQPETSPPFFQVTGTFIGKTKRSAVINGRRYEEGDMVHGSTRLTKVGYGWIEIEDSEHAIKRITINKQTEESESQ